MKRRIMIVDDIPENRMLLASVLKAYTEHETVLAKSGEDVIEMLQNNSDFKLPDLILMDIMMQGLDGFETTKKLKEIDYVKNIPIIFLTALSDTKSIVDAYEAGGVDYVTKPFNRQELLARVNTHLKLNSLVDQLSIKNKMLEDREVHLVNLVNEKTKKIEGITLALVNALENANLLNDDDTGKHIKRVSKYSALLAKLYGCDNSFIKKIELYSPLHDVGKVGTPDNILKKPGKLTPEEFDKMKEHVFIGYKMLESEDIDLMAKNIARYHHEKWNGKGYLEGLSGEDIPLEARIVALADVYDALSTKRVYKDVFPYEKIEAIFKEEKGKHFEPKLIELFFENKEKFFEIKRNYS